MLKIVSSSLPKEDFHEDYAKYIGEQIGINWNEVDFPVSEFAIGLRIELEHGPHDPQTNIVDDDMQKVGKIALSHLKEIKNYYTLLVKMEQDANSD